MSTIPRLRKICYLERAVDYCSSFGFQSYDPPTAETDITDKVLGKKINKGRRSNARNVDRKTKHWRRVDSCCWVIGCMCTLWWVLVFLYHCLPVNMFPCFRVPETPGARMAAEGDRVLHPVVLVPGIVTGGLEIWEGKPCAEGLIRKRLWGGSFTEIIKRPVYWLEHLSLHNETGLDPPAIRVRPVHGLVVPDYFAPGYFVWAVLIENLAKIGYEEKNLYMAAYDWRLSFQNTEIRDQTLSRLKNMIELMFNANGFKKAASNVLFSEDKYVAVIRAIWLPGSLDSEMSWDSVVLLVPKGGETIWGNSDWFAEEGLPCPMMKTRDGPKSSCISKNSNNTNGHGSFGVTREPTKLRRIISFGQAASTLPSSQLPRIDPQDLSDGSLAASNLCQEVWTEYDELGREKTRNVADKQGYTGRTLLDLLHLVAPKMMKRAEVHFSHGIADDLNDPKYNHFKYWFNPLEMRLPNDPDMEIYCLCGVGIPTERSYVYKISFTDKCKSILFRIDGTANGDTDTCLREGVYFVDGDERASCECRIHETMSKGRLHKSRVYKHKPPASLLDGRALESGPHVDIMGNVALIEDILRVTVGATGDKIGGDVIYSDLMTISEWTNIRL